MKKLLMIICAVMFSFMAQAQTAGKTTSATKTPTNKVPAKKPSDPNKLTAINILLKFENDNNFPDASYNLLAQLDVAGSTAKIVNCSGTAFKLGSVDASLSSFNVILSATHSPPDNSICTPVTQNITMSTYTGGQRTVRVSIDETGTLEKQKTIIINSLYPITKKK